jgi:hypothetical protein
VSNSSRDFRHIGILEFDLKTGQGEDVTVYDMILLYNTNYLTADEAIGKLSKNEYSDYMIAMPANIFNGVFRNAGLGGSPCGIVS